MRVPFYYGFVTVYDVLVGAWVKLGLERFGSRRDFKLGLGGWFRAPLEGFFFINVVR